MKEVPKYKYHLLTWGGFYNKQYKDIHGFEPGDYLFDTLEERENYISKLEEIEKRLNAKMLAISRSEGFSCETRTTLHRICEYLGKQYYSTYDLGVNFDYSTACYFMEWKWSIGESDDLIEEELNSKVDYRKVKVISEWITGAFNQEND